ncbi:DUF11 domain-containing protein [Geomonas anaerohicana]|uniref:DUF11 domain-containing protein n=1 Tax=Geomonas anaerohicana TaxID=2798583 RepID=A0ABS0Y9C7_9BACT|nr:DUF11 domain-containing protein [Geomonas anaerohicana]MBJ6748908.1 DUF11 domain-containing protein [Geomonas anaerohicana]
MQRNKYLVAATVALALTSMPLAVWAQPKVTIAIKAEKEVNVTAKGKQVKKRVAAKGVQPGEEIIYTLSYVNSGTEAAKDVVISDPIPTGTAYIPGSASDADDLTFSIDKGKSFKKPTLLTYELKGSGGKMEKKVAAPEEYTDIRWTIPQIPAGGKGSVNFKVKVK